jgi:hypothetical protein
VTLPLKLLLLSPLAAQCCRTTNDKPAKHAANSTSAAASIKLSRRQALVQLPGSALLASFAALLAAEQLSTAVPPAAAAPGPRQLDPETKAAVAAALNKVVTKAKV